MMVHQRRSAPSPALIWSKSLTLILQHALQANSSSAAESKAEEQQVPLSEARALSAGSVQSMEATEKPERKLKETRTFNPRKMRPKRCAASTVCSSFQAVGGALSRMQECANIVG